MSNHNVECNGIGFLNPVVCRPCVVPSHSEYMPTDTCEENRRLSSVRAPLPSRRLNVHERQSLVIEKHAKQALPPQECFLVHVKSSRTAASHDNAAADCAPLPPLTQE